MKTTCRVSHRSILVVTLLFVVLVVNISCFKKTLVQPDDEALPACSTSECHSEYLKKRFVHDPVKAGICLKCHKVVTDEHPNEDILDFEFIVEGQELCFKCHEDIKKQIKTAKVQHVPCEKGVCILCHSPHSSDLPELLKSPTGELCSICHEDVSNVVKSGPYIHTPVKQDDCSACHDSHGTDNPNILKKDLHTKLYLPYDDESYALCFDCHSKEIMLEQVTTNLTKFRNGEMNLHFKHVNGDPDWMPCKACHSIHSGMQPMNMPFWYEGRPDTNVPFGFTRSENGGTCIVGCHKRKSYNRIKPVKYKKQ
jgi:predicted CXXCH cytochrome family protein